MEKKTQRDKVLSWLRKNGSLTVRDAVMELNIMSAPKRVEELRKMGYPITLEWKQTETGNRYGVYRLQEVN